MLRNENVFEQPWYHWLYLLRSRTCAGHDNVCLHRSTYLRTMTYVFKSRLFFILLSLFFFFYLLRTRDFSRSLDKLCWPVVNRHRRRINFSWVELSIALSFDGEFHRVAGEFTVAPKYGGAKVYVLRSW